MAGKPGGGVMAVRPGCSAGTAAGAALLSRLSSVLPESWDAASWAVCAPEPAQGEEAAVLACAGCADDIAAAAVGAVAACSSSFWL